MTVREAFRNYVSTVIIICTEYSKTDTISGVIRTHKKLIFASLKTIKKNNVRNVVSVWRLFLKNIQIYDTISMIF